MNQTFPLKNLLSNLVTIIIILIIFYIIFNIGRSIWKNYQINREIANIEAEIESLKTKNSALKNLILYYQTDTFKELEARKKLGLKKSDEKVIIIPENDGQTKKNEEELFEKGQTQNSQIEKKPNYVKWWYFVTGS